MTDFKFENQGSITYLVYTITPDDVIDSMSLGMLTNNKIAGLATTLFTQIDANKYIKYNVSAKVSAKQFLAGAVNKKRLLGVFKGIVRALLSAEDYMIDTRSILLDMDFIFADVSTCDTVLICLPIQSKEEEYDLGTFFKEIMFGTQFDQTENCDYVARIINYLNSTPRFSLTDFKELLEQIENVTKQPNVMPATPVVKPTIQQPSVVPATEPPRGGNSVNNTTPQSNSIPVSQNQPAQGSVLPNQQLKVTPPPATSVNPTTKQSNVSAPAAEKQISMFSLMMHYSKENAQIYKAQKAARKNAGKVPTTNNTKTKQKPHNVNSKVSVPVQNGNFGFAIPGQSTTAQSAQPMVQTQRSVPLTQQPVTQVQNPAPQVQQPVITSIPTQQPPFVPRQVPQGQPANFGETTVLGGGTIGETTVLTAAQNPNKVIAPHLIRKKNNEKISLNKPVFRVGKEKSYVDYFIGDNTAISRSHANFIIREGEYFVVDTNSTNHTFVNGTMIQSNVETDISHGDTIRLANEDFEFKLY